MSIYSDVEDGDTGVLYILQTSYEDGVRSWTSSFTREKYLKTAINRLKRYNEHGHRWGAQDGPPERQLTWKVLRLVGTWKEYEIPDKKQKVLF